VEEGLEVAARLLRKENECGLSKEEVDEYIVVSIVMIECGLKAKLLREKLEGRELLTTRKN